MIIKFIESEILNSILDKSDTKTTITYGVLDEVLTVTREEEPNGTQLVETYDYDKNLNLKEVTDPIANITEYDYDPRNLLEVVRRGKGPNSLPSLLESRYAYSKDMELENVHDNRQHLWTTTYDGFGRVAEKKDPTGKLYGSRV